MRPSLRFALAVLAALLVGAPASRGTTFYWNTPSGIYSNSTSWSSGGPPTSGDKAYFTGYSGTNYETVNFNRDETAAQVSVYNGDHVTFNLNGYTWTTTNSSYTSSYVGGGSPSSVLVTGGGVWDVSSFFFSLGDGSAQGDLTLNSGVVMKSGLLKISSQASGPTPSTLWVKSGAAYEIALIGGTGDVGNGNNHSATITGAGTIRTTTGNNSWQFHDYGVIAPGDAGTGTLTLQDAAIYAHNGSKLAMEIGGTNAGAFDQLLLNKVSIGGYDYMSFDSGSSLELNFLPSYTATGTNTFNLVVGGKNQLVNWANLTNNISFSSLSNTNFSLSLSKISLDGTHDALQLTAISLIPEPSTLAGAAAGLILLAFVRRRRA
jgi:hypothetical protein